MRNYNDHIYKEVRKKALKRDKRTCQMPQCGSKKRLNVHHIVPWSKAATLRFELNNLITLCRVCHDSIKNQEHHYESLFLGIIRGK
jgi:5-methylcytosine-specific restriction endonuclease McrA